MRRQGHKQRLMAKRRPMRTTLPNWPAMHDREDPRCDPRDVLNALRASIAVLDARGVVIAVNQAWIDFARRNGAAGDRFFVGANYLEVCERALAAGENSGL